MDDNDYNSTRGFCFAVLLGIVFGLVVWSAIFVPLIVWDII